MMIQEAIDRLAALGRDSIARHGCAAGKRTGHTHSIGRWEVYRRRPIPPDPFGVHAVATVDGITAVGAWGGDGGRAVVWTCRQPSW